MKNLLKNFREVGSIVCMVLVLSFVFYGSVWAAQPIRIVTTHWVGYGPLYLAKALGWFEEEGADVELVLMDDIGLKFAAYEAKKFEGNGDVVDSLISYYVPGGVKSKAVLMLDNSLGGDGIAVRKDINSVRDLKGKTVAFGTGTTAEFLLNVVLFENGMTEDDIVCVEMTGANAATTLLQGKVDAASTYEPYLTQCAESPDTKVLVSTEKYPGLIVDILFFRDDVVENRGDEIEAIVRTWYRALKYYREHPEEALRIMAETMGGWLRDPEEFRKTLKYIQLCDEEENKKYFSSPENPGRQIVETIINAVEIWGKAKKLTGKLPPPEELVDSSFVLE